MPAKDSLFASPLGDIGRFKFNQAVVDVFPDMLRRSVPGYESIITQSALLASRYVQPDTHLYDLGSSLGATAISMRDALMGLDPALTQGCEIHAIDNSADMVKASRRIIADSLKSFDQSSGLTVADHQQGKRDHAKSTEVDVDSVDENQGSQSTRVDSANLHHDPHSTRVDSADLHHGSHSTRVDSPDLHHDSHSTRIDSADLHHDSHSTRIDSADEHHGSHSTRVDSADLHHGSHSTRIDSADEHHGSHSTRVDSADLHHGSHSTRVDSPDLHHDSHSTRIDSADEHHGSHSTRVDSADLHHDSHSTRVDSADLHHGSHSTRVDSADLHHGSHSTRVGSADLHHGSHSTRIDSADAHYGTVSTQEGSWAQRATPIIVHEADLENFPLENASVVAMNFTLQFVDVDARAALMKKIADALKPGGVLILSEKVCFSDPVVNDMHVDMYHAFKSANGYSDLEISQKRTALENVLVPDTLTTHHERLLGAGFSHASVWFQCFNFASLIAIR